MTSLTLNKENKKAVIKCIKSFGVYQRLQKLEKIMGFGNLEAVSGFDKRIFTSITETNLIWKEFTKSGKRQSKIMNIDHLHMCMCEYVSINRSR